MDIVIKHYAELSKEELYEILGLRMAVFIVEQNRPYQDIDGYDMDAYHLICSAGGEIKGYMRILRPGTVYREASFGRVLVTDRGKGVASRMVESALGFIRDVMHEEAVRIESQTYIVGLYERFGFVKDGDEFMDAGIPHIQMVRGVLR